MKLKSKALILSMGMMSASVFANGFNTQLDLDVINEDGVDIVGLSGSYYFDSVRTANTPWAEAAFLGRNSNVSASYIDYSGDFDATVAGASFEFMGDKNNNIYASLHYSNADTDFGSDDSVAAEIGYFFSDNWLVAIGTSDDDDAPINLRTKYVAGIGGGQFFNVEADIDDESKDLSVTGDFYFQPQTSVGLTLSQAEGFDYGVSFQHFFNETVAFKVSYVSTDIDDVTSVGLTARF